MPSNQWYLLTNTHNLSGMIEHGLITDSTGFHKYYRDILDSTPGYIPLINPNTKEYSERVLQALTLAITEDSHLIPCIVEININVIESGTITSDKGDEIDIQILNQPNNNDIPNTVYIPSPIPLTCIKNIIFRNRDEKSTYIKSAKTQYANVPIDSFKTTHANKQVFKLFPDKQDISGSDGNNLLCRDFRAPGTHESLSKEHFRRIYSLGGALGALWYMSKNGEISEKYFSYLKDISDKLNPRDMSELNEDFTTICMYFDDINNHSIHEGSTKQIFYSILREIVNDSDCKDAIIRSLNEIDLSGSDSEKAIERVKQISNRLGDFSSLKTGDTASKVFETSKSKKSKIEFLLLMLFHRKSSEELFELPSDKNDLTKIFTEVDYILFSLLFGIRDKYSGLPLYLKKCQNLALFISDAMAKYAHLTMNSDLVFTTPEQPKSVFNMLSSNGAKFQYFIDWASKQLELEDKCFKTEMPSKEFTNIKGKSIYPTRVISKICIVDDDYFRSISSTVIDDKRYNKILDKFDLSKKL